ncbi:MAG: M23 family metallopeptidase [Deltaproteobacteria bacterium]|nr:M23 family metallopeptidase [Deltaproteobacteria bacterium]
MDRKKTGIFLTIVPLIIILGLLAWLLSIIFEGQKPLVQIKPLPQFLSESREFTLNISDEKRGLKHLVVSVNQGGRETTILEKEFPFKGMFNREGAHKFNTKFSMNPSNLNLAQGRVDLKVRVWDYSRRSGGDGNLSQVSHKMVVDTVPPSIRAISRLNYVNLGGTGLIMYQTSSDTVKSGLYVNDLFFPGFPAGVESKEGFRVCYFAVPCDTKANPDVYLWAEDRAGNLSRGSFHYNIRKKRFRTKRINITDRFLKSVLPYFSFYPFDPEVDDITKFLKINRDLRKENNLTFNSLRTKTSPRRLWKGDWIRLKNAANMAGFGDLRSYYHKGEKIDQQVHMGVDLASLANAKVQAANNGRVIFSDRMGIYGLTVVLDHGQGLASVYSHLSRIDVTPDREVAKGHVIGLTGQTGLAGGDHLHFGIMVGGVFVNPIEWWDRHWIQDNVTRKLARLDE